MWKRILWQALLGIVALLVVIQLVPYGRDHTNPPTTAEPRWNSPATRELAVRACFDCHSNQTVWPWYSNVAPPSLLLQHDVLEGRERLNFSEWDRGQEADDAAEQVQSGEMPPWYYTLLHPSANLSQAEKDALIQGLNATTGGGESENDKTREEDD